ncbi:3-deoxy-D-manno-octulosonic acid transferase [Parafilimonas terrae]|uniref:3-deoxy-D-manno-octulosonic acid transferase n=1 Tax=Parafilimonas terrae TaxID=1465490 RepID=A0A1I5XPP2_9BACT|nr:glycosyltransferase N-terminal domain-containing protein [Parafilimonas terrae]SFQ33932.1 3-deoxy-D-manno-octulosonic-acid transferase [Parafilimonas terrae]
MFTFFYNIFIKLYPIGAAIISPFNEKAALWIKGRKNIFNKISAAIADDTSLKIWMHCSSLGEFEQGRPLLEKFRQLHPSYKLVLTFFSPSGYEVQKNNKVADYIFYLPVDSKPNAKKFVQLIRPSLVVFVKYEYWYYYLKEINKRNIPLILVSGIFFPGFSFFQWYGKLQRQMLTFFTHFFVQTEDSKNLLHSINVNNVTVSGDTRFDRVLEVASELKQFPVIENFISDKKVVVAGSTWTEDDEALDHFANTRPELRFIVAPHDISKERLEECCKLYKHAILFSEYEKAIAGSQPLPNNINTLIIDNIGTLKFLYRYATICYVGGGFGDDGIHNILEAAVYYKPVLFGPAFDKFYEALQLIDKGGAFDVEDAIELEAQLDDLLQDEYLYRQACRIAGDYVKDNAGATGIIMKYIQEKRLLTS